MEYKILPLYNDYMGLSNKKLTIKIMILLLFIFLLIMLVGEAFIRMDIAHEERILHDSLLTTGAFLVQSIQQNIASCLDVPKTLESLLDYVEYDTSGFEDWGKNIFSSYSSLFALQLAPDGIVSYCYPLEGNESIIGHDLLLDTTRDDGARKAIESKQLTFIGPVKLKQNGKWAIIARKPLFRIVEGKEQFWGFSIAIMLLTDILPDNLKNLEQDGLYVSFKGDNPDTEDDPVFYISEGYETKGELIIKVDVPNGAWRIGLNHTRIKNDFYIVLRLLLAFLGILICTYIVVQQVRMARQTHEILSLNAQLHKESLHDKLTEIGNRRYGENVLRQLIKEAHRYQDKFSIAMMDLDYFKEINDSYGHNRGDIYLKHFTKVVSENIRESDFFIRYGGDEFLIIFPRTEIRKVKTVINKIYESLQYNPCILRTESKVISVSTGVVEYIPDEGMRQSIERVDKQLYRSKESGKNSVYYG